MRCRDGRPTRRRSRLSWCRLGRVHAPPERRVVLRIYCDHLETWAHRSTYIDRMIVTLSRPASNLPTRAGRVLTPPLELACIMPACWEERTLSRSCGCTRWRGWGCARSPSDWGCHAPPSGSICGSRRCPSTDRADRRRRSWSRTWRGSPSAPSRMACGTAFGCIGRRRPTSHARARGRFGGS
jgi:hypothetical protein